MPELTVTHDAADKKAGMTVSEVQAFVDQCMRAGLPLTTPVKTALGWKQQCERLIARGDV